MVDPYLQQLARVTDQGYGVPLPVRVLAGNTLFVGQPGPASMFKEKVVIGLAEEHYNARRPSKKDADRVYQEAIAHGEEAIEPLMNSVRGAESGDVLTLIDCQIWPASGGDGVQVPVVRIPLAAIDGWWPGAGKRLKSGAGGGWLVGFGVLVPLDGDA